jgi:hypothetical protein
MPSSDRVAAEKTARQAHMATVAVNANSQITGEAPAAKQSLEATLTRSGYVARVQILLGTYVKVKWYKDNKIFCQYKDKNFTVQKALDFLTLQRSNYEAGFTDATSVSVLPATATKSRASAFSQQYTPTVLPAGATDKSVSYSISPANANLTISSTGLLNGTTSTPIGAYTITVRTDNGAFTATSALTVTA